MYFQYFLIVKQKTNEQFINYSIKFLNIFSNK